MVGKGTHRLSFVHLSRALAISLVLLGHVNILFYNKLNYDWFHMGQWERTGGVDFFFIVSGFMIYYLYHKDFGVTGKSRQFLIKRAIRIYPLTCLFTLSTLGMYLLIPSAAEQYTQEIVIKSLLHWPTTPIIPSAWSLSHIIFFYLIFSSLIFKPKVFKPLIAIWIAVIFLNKLLVPNFHSFILSFSTLEIIGGCFVAYVTLNVKLKYSTWLICLGMMGYVGVWVNMNVHFINIYEPIFYCLFAMLMMMGIAMKDRKARRLPKSLSLLGDASYSIFVSHDLFQKLYLWVMMKMKLTDVLGYFLSMSAIIILTVLSGCGVYFVVEKPFTSLLRRIVMTKKGQSRTKLSRVHS